MTTSNTARAIRAARDLREEFSYEKRQPSEDGLALIADDMRQKLLVMQLTFEENVSPRSIDAKVFKSAISDLIELVNAIDGK